MIIFVDFYVTLIVALEILKHSYFMGLFVQVFLSFDSEAKNPHCIENMIHTLLLQLYIFDAHYLDISLGI